MNWRYIVIIQLVFVLLVMNNSYSQPWEYAITESSHNIIFPEDLRLVSDTGVISPPVHIGVFYDSANTGNEVCAGYLYWTGESNQVLTAYGEKSSPLDENIIISGFKQGDRFRFKFAKNGCILKVDSVSYQEPGGFLITQRDEFNDDGISKINEITFTLGAISTDSSLICINEQDIVPISIEGISSYELNIPAGLVIDNSENIIVNQSQEGDYRIKVNSEYCFSHSVLDITIDKTQLNLPDNADGCGEVLIALPSTENIENIFWSNGSTLSSIEVINSDIYTVEARSINGCPLIDSINVEVYPIPTLDLGIDTSSCSAFRLKPEGDFTSLVWSTGDSTNFLDIRYPGGIFEATASNEYGCTNSDTIDALVTSNFEATLPENIIICTNDDPVIEPIISGNHGSLQYEWSTGDRTSYLEIEASGQYNISVTNRADGCVATTGVNVLLSDFSIRLPNDTTFCLGEAPIIAPAIFGDNINLIYQWSTGESTSSLTVDETGEYTVEVTNGIDGCVDIASSQVLLSDFYISLPDTVISCSETALVDPSLFGSYGEVGYSWHIGSQDTFLVVDQSGYYSVEITNNSDGCVDIDSSRVIMGINPWDEIEISLQNIDCNTMGLIELETTAISSRNYQWSINQNSWQDQPIFEGLEIGDYELGALHLESECSYSDPRIFTIVNQQTAQCKGVVVTPNGDGYQDYYEVACFPASVYDRFGYEVRTFSQSVKWYGLDNNGNRVKPGYYVIRCLNSDKEIGVSVIY